MYFPPTLAGTAVSPPGEQPAPRDAHDDHHHDSGGDRHDHLEHDGAAGWVTVP